MYRARLAESRRTTALKIDSSAANFEMDQDPSRWTTHFRTDSVPWDEWAAYLYTSANTLPMELGRQSRELFVRHRKMTATTSFSRLWIVRHRASAKWPPENASVSTFKLEQPSYSSDACPASLPREKLETAICKHCQCFVAVLYTDAGNMAAGKHRQIG